MHRVRVAVVRGGMSDEYEVSMRTGAAVIANLDPERFAPIDVIILRSGEWLVDGRVRLPEQILYSVDVVFNALHGTFGEDGTFQRLLERYAVPYTGSKVYASNIAMNKILTKRHLRDAGVRFAPHVHVTRESRDDIGRVAERIMRLFGPQYVVKPVASGSSVGTRMVTNPLLLHQALREALDEFEEVMVEQRIKGREATCGVAERYRGHDLYAFPAIEIVPPPHAEYFDATVKYSGETRELCPSTFDMRTKHELERLAKLVHRELGLSQYSRSDFIVAPDGVYFLEVNTLPGLTPESLLPKAIEAVGGSYGEFLAHLIDDACRVRVS
ncbi:MAG TPA: D-alanine--D-alanine ligase [Candidatus Paceibacterota bacterium]|nr:D-alanine--D-alanine ligase [Candidatus Paceibacterota bacterium]